MRIGPDRPRHQSSNNRKEIIQMIIRIDDKLSLEPIGQHHAQAMFELVDRDRQHLREWLPWVDSMQTIEHYHNHITYCKKAEEQQTDFAYVIIYDGKMAGRIGIHYIHHHNRIASIGYWLASDLQGKGIISRACIAIVDHCFDVLGMNRIEIKAATGNKKSQAIPERLKFVKEGIIRQGEFLNGKFVDLYLYSILRQEWKKI